MLQLFIKGFQGKVVVVEANIDDTVESLINKYFEKIGYKIPDMRFVYTTKELNPSKILKQYNFQKNSTIFALIRLRGGHKLDVSIKKVDGSEFKMTVQREWTVKKLKQQIYKQCSQLAVDYLHLSYAGINLDNERNLASYGLSKASPAKTVVKCDKSRLDSLFDLKLISYNNEDDVFGMEEGMAFKMGCGHSVGSDGMTAFLRSLISVGKYQVKCPGQTGEGKTCGKEWDIKLCMKVGVLTDKEEQEISTGFARLYAAQVMGFNECKYCYSYFYLPPTIKQLNVYCEVCLLKTGKRIMFCRRCLKDWVPGHQSQCNKELNQLLKNCERKNVVGLSTYSLRMCPGCGIIIQHEKDCKHMTCKRCNCEFCFICLRLKVKGTGWTCGGYDSHCQVAPPQQL